MDPIPHIFTDNVRQTASGAQLNDNFATVKAAIEALEALQTALAANVPPGLILEYAGATAPATWAMCDGTAVTVGMSAPLRTLLLAARSPFGLSGADPKLPDLRGRTPIGVGTGSGLTARTLGQLIGEENHRLSYGEMPPHAHDFYADDFALGAGGVGGYMLGDITGQSSTHRSSNPGAALGIDNAGGGLGHNNIQPSLGLNFICKL